MSDYRCFLIGVAGGTASGKTTACDRIVQQLESGVVLVHEDAFYKCLTKEEHDNVASYNFDHPNAIDDKLFVEAIKTLASGQPVDVPIYDFKLHARSPETRRINPAPVIMVEGILVLAIEEVRELFHMKIFVDTDDDVRLARRVQRDIVERGRDVSSVLHQYMTFVKPAHENFVVPSRKHADIIVPWAGGHNEMAIDLIVQHIRSKIGTNDLRAVYQNLHLIPINYQVRAMLTIIRDRTVEGHTFIFFADRLIRLVVEFGLSFIPHVEKEVNTPTGDKYPGVAFNHPICGVSIIRSGETMENALRNCCMGVKIGKFLLNRKPFESAGRELVYENVPDDVANRHVLLLDPVLSTGFSACLVIERLLARGVKQNQIIFLTIVATEEGIHRICKKFPLIKLVTAEIEKHTDANGCTSVGYFGDRYFGTSCGDVDLDLTRRESMAGSGSGSGSPRKSRLERLESHAFH